NLIGLPRTSSPKSWMAICAAVTDPEPEISAVTPDISVNTPILTTLFEMPSCAEAVPKRLPQAAMQPATNKYFLIITRASFVTTISVCCIYYPCHSLYFYPNFLQVLDSSSTYQIAKCVHLV